MKKSENSAAAPAPTPVTELAFMKGRPYAVTQRGDGLHVRRLPQRAPAALPAQTAQVVKFPRAARRRQR